MKEGEQKFDATYSNLQDLNDVDFFVNACMVLVKQVGNLLRHWSNQKNFIVVHLDSGISEEMTLIT